MGKVLVAILGNSDVLFDKIILDKNSFRNVTSNLREELAAGKIDPRRLEFPILEALASRIKMEGESLDLTYLVYTDQRDPHQTDTCNLYELFVEWWKVKKGEVPWKFLGNKKPKGFRVEDAPHDYDATPLYGRKLADRINRDLRDKGIKKVYLSLTGGTPALVVGILWALIDRWGDKVYPLYVSRGSPIASKLNFGLTILRKEQLNILRELVARKSYKGAADVMEKTFSDEERKPVFDLLLAGYRWVNFDFDGCLKHLDRVGSEVSIENKEALRGLRDEIYLLTMERSDNDRSKALLVNLVEVMKLNLEKGQYAYLLGNIFRFQEGLMQYILSNEIGMKFEDQGRRIGKGWLNEHTDVEEYLDNRDDIQWKNRGLNRIIMRAIIDYYNGKNPDIDDLVEIIDAMEPLANLRNKSIIAHEYQGLNRDILEKQIGKSLDSLIEKIEDMVVRCLGRSPDFLDRLNQIIIKEISIKKDELFV